MGDQKRGLVFVTLAVLAVASLLLWFILSQPHHESGDRPVKIGYLPIYVDLPLFVAVEKGFFDRRGVAVELQRFASSPEIGTALVADQIQVGASIAYSVALSIESRDPGSLRVFIVDSENRDNYLSSIVVKPDSGIESVDDLRGKKLASFPGPTALTFFKMVLEDYGLDPENDLTIVELEISSHISALESGLVDGLLTYEPTATQAVVDHDAIKLLPGAIESHVIDPWQAGVWVTSSNWAENNRTVAARVMLALYDAIDYMRAEPQEAKKALRKFTSIRDEVAAQTPTIPFAKIDEVDLKAFQRHADILFEREVLGKQLQTRPLLIPQDWLDVQPEGN